MSNRLTDFRVPSLYKNVPYFTNRKEQKQIKLDLIWSKYYKNKIKSYM